MKNLFCFMQGKKNSTMMKNFINEIVSGGQTGVDRAALDVAMKFRIKHGGWCPYGRIAEDGVIPLKYLLKESPPPALEESSDPDVIYKKRTELNAKGSDGTLIIIKDPPIGGTLYTIEMAKKHNKPWFVFKVGNNYEEIKSWIINFNIKKLNVAGPRASQAPGIYDSVYDVLCQLLTNELISENKIDSISEKKYKSKL